MYLFIYLTYASISVYLCSILRWLALEGYTVSLMSDW